VVAESGLFFDQSALDRFRFLYGTPTFADLRARIESIDRQAERRFLTEEIRYNDQLFDIGRVANLATDMAFHNMLVGDADAVELAVSCMDALARFERWDYFLEAGDRVFGLQRAPAATVATSLCWDWLEGFVDDADRRAWLTVMGERGCEANWLALYGMRYPDRVVGWSIDETSTFFEHRPGERIDLSNWPHILDRTNLKAVPASALAIGAVAYARGLGIEETQDERLAKWIEQATFSLRTFGDLYAADGSYDEGVSYANYTSSHIAQATVALERYNNANLYDELNWAGYVDYLCGMSMATADDPTAIVNFGDAGGGSTSSVPFWVAAREGDKKAQWFGDVLAREHDIWSLLWLSETEASAPPESPSLWHSSLDWVVARTGYRPDDLVVAMRSGGPANHEHADRNSIIVKWGGEVLVADPPRPPYAYTDPAWMMRTTAGHSAVLVDGAGHQYHDGSEGTNPSDAWAHIVRIGERDGYMFWTSDATTAYALVNDDIASVTRTVYVFTAMRSALIVDTVVKREVPSTFEARFFGDNRDGGCSIEPEMIEGGGARLIVRRPLASATITGVSAAGVRSTQGRLPIPDETAAINPFGSLTTQTPSVAATMVAFVAPFRGAELPDVSLVATGDGVVEVIARHGVNRVRCTVSESGPIPAVVVREAR
jgi:hypothetical protein